MSSKIIVAIDAVDYEQALALVKQLDPSLCRLKIGNILFTAYGPSIVAKFQDLGYEIFLDLKFHDIPQTVALACRAAAQLGVWMINLHISGGRAMMAAAVEALSRVHKKPLLTGVTVLTSLKNEDIQLMGEKDDVEGRVLRLATFAYEVGLDGVVCSAHEATFLRPQLSSEFVLVTPGIRLAGASTQDQKRVMTPEAALQAGSDYLVVGRAITQADSPRKALEELVSISHLGVAKH